MAAFPSGDRVAKLSVGTSTKWKDQQTGEWQSKTQWHKVALFKGNASWVEGKLFKGDLVHVDGSIEYQTWKDKSGVDKYKTEIKGKHISLLKSKNENKVTQNNTQDYNAGVADDDIPF